MHVDHGRLESRLTAHVTCVLEEVGRLPIAWDIQSGVSGLTAQTSCFDTWAESLRLADEGPVSSKWILGRRGGEGRVGALDVRLRA